MNFAALCSPAQRLALVLSVVSSVSAVVVATRLSAEDWPQFRGENAAGVSSSTGLPTKFSARENVLWQATLGDGVGSAVIAGGRVYNTSMTGPEEFSVFAHDAATGRELWKRSFPTGTLPRITPPNSHASSTPATDGQRVYAYFSTLGLIALQASDGRQAWRHELPKPAYLMDWGAGASPVVRDGLVYFCQDDDLAPFVIAIDAQTGKTRWRTPRFDMLAGYAIPVFCTAGGRTDLVLAGSGKLKGYDPGTGEERWTCNTLLRTIMTSPVVQDDKVFVAVQSYGDATRTLKFALLQWLDTNQDGTLSRKEVPKEFWEKFDLSDKNKDGTIDATEIDSAFQHPQNMAGGGNTIQAVRGGGQGDVTKTHLVWNIENRSPSNLSSPLVVGQKLFVVKAGGLSSCFDTEQGKTHYQLARIRNLGDYYASPIAADGKIFVAGRNGFVVVLEDSPELKILEKNDLEAEILATPSIADGRLFIRTRDKIYCIAAQK